MGVASVALAVGGTPGIVVACVLGLPLAFWQARGALRASSRLSRASRSFREGERRLQAVLGATLEGVIALDRRDRVTHLNRAAAKLLRVELATVEGVRLGDLCQNEDLLQLVEDVRAENTLCSAQLTHGGLTLQVYATPLKGDSGVVLVLHDYTEVRRLENMRRDFVANVSHELKTPLTSIRAYVDTLLDGGMDDRDNNLRFLRKIDTHVHRLAVLITDLLSLSRIESGQAVSRRIAVDLAQALQDTVRRLEPAAQAQEIRLSLVLANRGSLTMSGDDEAVRQILDNLIDNAIKYTEPGGEVRVEATREDDRIQVTITDTGVGIPPQDLPRIFERFYRVDKARSREIGGTGLGLSIVKHYVQALEGEIKVHSKVGEGTRVTLAFPAARDGPAAIR